MSQPYWVEVELRLILRLRLIWTWGWNEVEMRFSRSLAEIELRLSWDKLTLNKGRNWAFIGVGLWFKIFWGLGSGSNCFGVYLYSAIIFIFFVSFNSDLILGLLWLFGALLGYFWFNVGLKNCFGVNSCSLTTVILYGSWILTFAFDFDLMLGSFLTLPLSF